MTNILKQVVSAAVVFTGPFYQFHILGTTVQLNRRSEKMNHFGKLLLVCISLLLMICTHVFAEDNTCGENIVFTITDGIITFSKEEDSHPAAWDSDCVEYINENITKVVIDDPMDVGDDLDSMFAELAFVEEMDLSKFDTKDVIWMSNAFENCSSLTKLNLSGWDTSEVKFMDSMFSGCSKLVTLKLGDEWDTSQVIYMQNMFDGCSALETVPGLSEWKTSNLARVVQMFKGCSKIKEVDLSKWDKSNLNVIQAMFSGCTSLETLNLSNWDTEYLEDPIDTFAGCNNLRTLTLGDKQQDLVVGDMFYTLPDVVYAGPWLYIAKAEGIQPEYEPGKTILAGSELFGNYNYSNMGGTWTRVYMIDQVDIIDISDPTANQMLDTSASTDTENITINNDGAVSWDPDDTTADYKTEYTAFVTVSANEGYIFADTVTAKINGKTADVNKNDDGTLTISYTFPETEEKTYTVTVSDDGNGIGSAEPESGKQGDTVTLSAVANEGWRFKEWKVIESGGGTLNGDTFTIGTGDAEIEALFEEIEYQITVTTDGNGTASADPASGPKGTEAALTAKPKEGYKFKEWKVIESGGGTLNGDTFTIGTGDAEIEALFEAIEYQITVTTDGNGTATADPTSGKEGDKVTLTAKPAEGYKFKEWKVIESGGGTLNGDTFTIGTGDAEIEALFEAIEYQVTVTSGGNGTASADPASGKEGDKVKLTAKPDEGYHFKEWKVSGSGTLDGDTFTIGNGPAEIQAVFEKDKEPDIYTVTVTVVGNGTASANPTSGPTGTEVLLTAQPDDGWEFKEWNVIEPGGGTLQSQKAAGASETAVFIIGTADAEIQAVFEKSEEPQPPVPPRPEPVWPPFFRLNDELPKTGITGSGAFLTGKPASVNYKPVNMELQIPSLYVTSDIVTVPLTDDGYAVAWLGSDAGLLEGFALPGEGVSVIAGHNTLNAEEFGPFAAIRQLDEGERFFVRDARGKLMTYEVYANEKIGAGDAEALQRSALAYENTLTLLTCEDELPEGGYASRRIVSAKYIN